MKPVYVIGHKNPDVDSIAAAIAYKVYKQSSAEGLYIAAAAGELNEESGFVLEQLEFEVPAIVKNVGTTVDDLLDMDEIVYVTADMTVVELSNFMQKHRLRTLPVLDDKHKFLGLLTIGDLAMIFMERLGQGKDVENSPEILRDILSKKVADIMKTRDLVLFESHEAVEDARKQMLSSRFRNYPVVDEDNRYLGMISRYDLLQMKRKKVILVDHNEKKQAVDGVDEAEILEIIDHHRVGDLQTIMPIYFHNEPVGSTCTLVAEAFLGNSVYFSPNLAGLMLSGILSDTMIFKSPTTTAKDRRVAAELERMSGLNSLEWGKAIYSTSHLELHSEEELITEDLKEYVSGDELFAVAQVETVDLGRIRQRKDKLVNAMQEVCQRHKYAFMCLMVTDILEAATELIVAGDKSNLVEQAFGQTGGGGIYLHGVMSRKKQVVPVIYEALRKQKMM
ncbi:putative manganese-dependent inorganic diphosphatase [Syntrophomonas curvata]